MESALREALSLGHQYVGTEHLLLGLVAMDEGVAARLLLDFDVDAERIRTRVTEMLASAPPAGPGHGPPGSFTGAFTSQVHPRRDELMIEAVRQAKEKEIDAQNFEAAVRWRDVERKLLRGERIPWPGELTKPSFGVRLGYQLTRAQKRHPWRWLASSVIGFFGLGILIGRLIWG